MKNISIKAKLLTIVLSTIVVISLILVSQSINTIKSISDENIQQYKKDAYKTKSKELENYVSVALNTLDTFYKRSSKDKIQQEVEKKLKDEMTQLFKILNDLYNKNKNKLSQKELQQRLIDIVKSNRYGKNGYFWINDFQPKIIMHPLKPHLIGKVKKGVKHWDEFVQKGKIGEGFVAYVQNLKGKQLQKISYVKTFKPFNWIIGTGAYIDDVTKQLQQDALQAISKMRYGKSGYFWINDMQPKMIMHPFKPSLNGKDLSGVKDPNGVYLFNEMVKVCKKSQNGGLVKYSWAKPGKSKPQPKFSYVKEFKQWHWIVGTGAYVDIIEDKVAKMHEETNQKINKIIVTFLIESLVLILVILFIVSIVINKNIIAPLKSFEDGFLTFFKYLNKETTTIKHLDDSANDEIGNMAKIVNKNIIKAKTMIDEDAVLLEHAQSVMEKVIKGWYNETISGHTSNHALESFKDNVNKMIIATKEHFVSITKILDQYANLNYTAKVKLDNIVQGGVFEILTQDINKLRDSITEVLIHNKQNGLTLQNNANLLLENVLSLSNSSNEAATSLEETAAALEEITSNISNNTNNVIQMASHGHEVKNLVSSGQNLANQTTTAMDDINNEVVAISESITVIDQIAFQTNILSLNAAVEAATAGEAGKGFAVVAGEVRNLAARSAEAANEIKTLVENATSKANSGKQIADEMIDGYTHLNKSISQTLELIASVENASKEQQSGIEQINNAINGLDQQTQKNANVANTTKAIAIDTQTIANAIVKDADSKEFEGKQSIVVKKI
jgi:methyl-accepting chemotaxis protein